MNGRSGVKEAIYHNHTSTIYTFVPFPVEQDEQSRKKVIALSRDNALTVLDLEDLCCKARLVGHAGKIVGIHWRSSDGMLAVECAGSVHVWEYKTKRLESVADEITSDAVLGGFTAYTRVSDFEPCITNSASKSTVQLIPIKPSIDGTLIDSIDSREGHPIGFVTMINLRRLIKDISTGKLISPFTSPRIPIRTRERTTDSKKRTPSSLSYKLTPDLARLGSSPGKKFLNNIVAESARVKAALPGFVSAIRGKSLLKPDVGSVKSGGLHAAIKAHAKELSVMAGRGSSSDSDSPLDASLIQAIYGQLLTWGLDLNVDSLCSRIGIAQSRSHVTLGIQGISSQSTDSDKWRISPGMTTIRTIAIITLTKAIFTLIGDQGDVPFVSELYESKLPACVGDRFQYASFSMLAKYWQDPSGKYELWIVYCVAEIQTTVRGLLKGCIVSQPAFQRDKELAFWKQTSKASCKLLTVLVSSDQASNEKLSLRAAIILGIVCHIQPSIFTQLETQRISLALETVIRDDQKGIYKVTAIELIGLGFEVWSEFIDCPATIRLIIAQTGFEDLDHKIPLKFTSSTDSLSTLNRPTIHPLISYNARHALTNIARTHTTLYLSTLLPTLATSPTPSLRLTYLHTLIYTLEKLPTLLYAHLPEIIDSMIRSLDPHTPGIRDALLPLLTRSIYDIVKRFGGVAFSDLSQRLIVGTEDGKCVLYDLRTAARIQIIDAYGKSVTAVSFSPDGKLLATYSLEENTVKIYQPTSGIFGALVGAFGAVGMPGASSSTNSGMAALRMFRSFSIGPASDAVSVDVVMKEVKVEWISERGVKIRCVGGEEFIFQI